MTSEEARPAEDVEQSPALRAQADALKTNIQVRNQPMKMQVHEAYRGVLKFTRIGGENRLSMQVTDNAGSRATAAIELEDDELKQFVDGLNEVIEDDEL